MPTDLIWWLAMCASATYSLIIGYRWGYRNGRKEGLSVGKKAGMFWAKWGARK